MNTFTSIDDKLNEFAEKHNAEIHTREIGFDGQPKDEIEIRKIIWFDDKFLKAIFILPQSVSDPSSFSLWGFEILAVFKDPKAPQSDLSWMHHLLLDVPFQEIENQIDYLLTESERRLSAFKVEDMRLEWTTITHEDGTVELI